MKILVTTKTELKNLLRLKNNLKDQALNELLEGIGEYMVYSVRENFEEGGRPERWQPLKWATKKRKRGTKILVESGRLIEGIAYEVLKGEGEVEVGPTGETREYGLRHNRGDRGNRPIPKREYLEVQEEDREYIEAFIRASIL